MAGGQEQILRRRIKSVQATQKITRAMELIAASQIVRAQGRIAGAAPYLKGIAEVLAEAAADAGENAGRVLGVPESPERVLVVAVVADRGLCGGYNANVLRPTERLVRTNAADRRRVPLVTVGRKAQSFFRFRHIEVETSFIGFSDRPTFEDARRHRRRHHPAFPGRAGRPGPRRLHPLPVGRDPGGGDPSAPAPARTDGGRGGAGQSRGYTEFEPESPDLLVELVPRYVEAAIFGALLEASASEHTARQRAMAAATDNADDLVKNLTAGDEPGPPGRHHHRDHGDRRWRRGPAPVRRLRLSPPNR